MPQVVYDNILCVGYLIVWCITLIWYQRLSSKTAIVNKFWRLDAGSFIIFMYIVYAFFSVISVNDTVLAVLSDYKPLTLFPYIYLYLMMMLSLTPIIQEHRHPYKQIENPHTKTLTIAAIIIIVAAIGVIPSLNEDGANFMKLFTDVDAGKDAYMEQVENVGDSGSKIRNLPAVIYNMFSDMTVFLLMYFLTLDKKPKLLILGLGLALVVGFLMPIMKGQRGGVIALLLTIIGSYFLFRRYLSTKINRIVSIAGVVTVLTISVPIIAITVSRFGDTRASVGGFVYWYVGQGSLYFNNNGLDAGGTRDGDLTMGFFKRLIDPSTPNNLMERRDKHHNLLLDDNLFSTFVGDFTIDYGPIPAVCIFLVFNMFVLYEIRARGDTDKMKLYNLILIYFVMCIHLQGGMTLFSYSDAGNMRILIFALFYIYLRYHEVLLVKFPLVKSEPNEEVTDKPS